MSCCRPVATAVASTAALHSRRYTRPTRKATIPKTLKIDVWNHYIGEDKGSAPCPVCGKKITQMTFQCCHIIAESKGGSTTLDNLVPGCDKCNQSMGNQNLNEFKVRYYTSAISSPLPAPSPP